MSREYKVTDTSLIVKVKPGEADYDEHNPHLNWRPATEQEMQLPQPGPDWYLRETHSNRDATVLICVWERVVP